MNDETDVKTYAGWKAGLLIVGVVLVTYVTINVVARVNRHAPTRVPPSPVIVSVTP